MKRRISTATSVLLIACLAFVSARGLAAEAPSEPLSSDIETRPKEPPSPWVGLAVGTGVTTFGMGIGFVTWWYKRGDDFDDNFKTWDRGWLDEGSYTGGHDKVGHLYSNYFAQHVVTALYEAIGFDRKSAIWWSAGVVFISFNLVEVFDGYTHFGWEYGDCVFNFVGHAFGVLSQAYHLERFVQMRLGWIPSRDFIIKKRRKERFLEDYSGQRFYLLAMPAGIAEALGYSRKWLAYVAPGIYYDTRGYRPRTPGRPRERNIGLALALDFATIARELAPGNAVAEGASQFFRFIQPSVLVGYGVDLNTGHWHTPDVSLTMTARF